MVRHPLLTALLEGAQVLIRRFGGSHHLRRNFAACGRRREAEVSGGMELANGRIFLRVLVGEMGQAKK